MQKATPAGGTSDGTFTPLQFKAAVAAGDDSVDKGGFKRGGARNQQLANDAAGTLSSKTGDSGTAPRMLLNGALLTSTAHPLTSPITTPAAIGLGAASLTALTFPALAGANLNQDQPQN
jgi:hypothetical protein